MALISKGQIKILSENHDDTLVHESLPEYKINIYTDFQLIIKI